MKRKANYAVLALAALMSTTSLAAYAGSEVSPSYETQEAMLKTADEALIAVTRAHAARLALFENDIEAAKSRVSEALAELGDVETILSDYLVGDTEDPASEIKYLPFDMSMSLTETFADTPENHEALAKAHRLIQTGKTDDAIHALRMAPIEVNVSTAMLPAAESYEALEKAKDLIDEGKYFDANLALKKLEDSVIVRTYSIDEIPVQGSVK